MAILRLRHLLQPQRIKPPFKTIKPLIKTAKLRFKILKPASRIIKHPVKSKD